MILMICAGCSKSDTDVENFGYNYYPVAQGNFIIYLYREYIYDDFDQTIDTVVYELKELIDSAFIDGEGRTFYKLKRYNRFNDTLEWNLLKVWTITPGQDRLLRTEENVTYVELNFPLRHDKTWNGNVLNIMPAENFRVANLDLAWKLNGLSFDRICRITRRENVNLIEEKVAEKVYAWGIGPILIRDKNIAKDVNGSIISGYDRTMTYIFHGKQ